MTFEPYEFQIADQVKLSENNYTGLLAIEPGGGKTAASLLAHRNSGSDVTLVVAPDSTHRNAWIPDAAKVLGEEPRIIGNSGRKAVKEAMADFKLGYPGIYLVTPQLLTRSDTSDWMMDLLVIDEGHQINNPGSKGQKAMQSLTDKSGGRMYLSGTPWRNNFERSWSVMRFLWPELQYRGQVAHDNFYGWKLHRMMSEEVMIPPLKWFPTTWDKLDSYKEQGYWWKKSANGPMIGKPRASKKWLNESEPGKLLSEAPCVIIHKKREECCEYHTVERQGYAGFLNLEEPQEIKHVVNLTSKQNKAIEELEKQYVTWLEDNPLVVDLPITLAQRIRQLCLAEAEVEEYEGEKDGETIEKQRIRFREDLKSPFYDQLLEILQEEEDNVVVYLTSQRFAEVVVKRLNKDGITAFEYSGQTKKDRDDNLQKFGTDFRVVVGVLSALGTGVDSLQKVSSTEVWLESDADDVNNQQAFNRLDRIGNVGQVQRHYILDPHGRAAGRMGEQLSRRLALNSTIRTGK